MSATSGKINFWKCADGLRVFSILAVIMLHTSAVRVANWSPIESMTWWVAHVCDSLCRWAVPVFIMLSGGLILDAERPYTILSFYKKRLARVAIPFVFWAGVYFYWSYKSYGMHITPAFIKNSLWQGLTYNHLYFIFIILGLYAVSPALRLMPRHLSSRGIWIAVILIMSAASTGILFRYLPMNGLTRFVPYIAYFLLGYVIRFGKEKIKRPVLFLAAFSCATAVIIFRTYQLITLVGRDDYRAFVWYDHFSIGVIIQSLCVLIFMRSMLDSNKSTLFQRFLKVISPVTFGIYLMHVVFLDLVRAYTSIWCAQWILFAILFEVGIVFILSCCVCLLLQRIPWLKILIGL